MNSKNETAVEIFNKGFNCAQAVLASHSSDFGLDSTIAKKIAGAFGGGMAYNGETCGAVTGALMLIGLKYGKHTEGDNDSKENTYRIAAEYISKFKKEYGSIKCTELIKYDLTIKEELIKAREAGVFKTICPLLVKRSVELAEELL
ncbi:MAG: C-GCAxxG-C-C family protein [Treponema sp.]|nr:C-GCAxxG-C-C family protein [Treponema sp.]